MRGDRVHRRAALDRADRVGGLRIFGEFEVGDLGDRAADGVHGRGNAAVVEPGVPAGAVDGEAPAVRTRGARLHASDRFHVERDEGVDLARTVKEGLGAADVAVAFFADRADEENVAGRFDLGGFEHAQNLEHGAQTRGVVADARTVVEIAFGADRHVGFHREDRVGVGGDRDDRTRAAAGTAADDVARRIDHNVRQAVFTEKTCDFFGAAGFFKGRGRDLGDRDLFGKRARRLFLRDGKRLLHGFVGDQFAHAGGDGGIRHRELLCRGWSECVRPRRRGHSSTAKQAACIIRTEERNHQI